MSNWELEIWSQGGCNFNANLATYQLYGFGKDSYLSVSQFTHLQNRDYNRTSLERFGEIKRGTIVPNVYIIIIIAATTIIIIYDLLLPSSCYISLVYGWDKFRY